MSQDKIALSLLQRYNKLNDDKASYGTTFEDIARYVRPERIGFISKPSEGEERTNVLYDDTAIQANTRLASALRYMLTDTSTKFFYLRTGNEELDDNYDVREWLDESSERMRSAMYSSNFTVKSDEFYLDLGSFNTAAMYIEEGTTNLLNFKTCNLADLVFTEDNEGNKDAVFMKYEYSALNAVKRFGAKNLHKDITDALPKQPDKMFCFIHVVEARTTADLTKSDNLNMPFASYWIDEKNKVTVSESGYMENPYSIARWRKMSNTSWGFGPGQLVLPTVRIVNERKKLNLRLERKYADPPLWAEDGSIDGPLRTGAGRVNWGRSGSNPPVPMVNINPSGMSWSESEQNQAKNDIYEAFFVNQLSLIDRTKMTATEVIQRTEENMRIMGPTAERIINEWLSPVINRVFGIMLRAGQFSQPPEELQGMNLDIKYESPLARANKGQTVDAIASATELIGGMAGVMGMDIIDWIDSDEWTKTLIEQKGLKYKSDEDVQASREARAQQQQQMAQMEAMQAGVSTAAEASKITPPA